MILTIAIPTLPERHELYVKLNASLLSQSLDYDGIEIIFDAAPKEQKSIGQKRQDLTNHAKGEYIVMIDDDDEVHQLFVSKIMEALQQKPDCVCYLELVRANGNIFRSIHSNRYADWGHAHDGYDYIRTPFYKDVIRTDIVRAVGIDDLRYAEDIEFARKLKATGLIEKEVFINDFMYIYNAPDSMTEQQRKERYGIV